MQCFRALRALVSYETDVVLPIVCLVFYSSCNFRYLVFNSV